jgi:hypothetical protein
VLLLRKYNVKIKYDDNYDNNVEDVLIADQITRRDLRHGLFQKQLEKKKREIIEEEKIKEKRDMIYVDNEQILIENLRKISRDCKVMERKEGKSALIERIQMGFDDDPQCKVSTSQHVLSISQLLEKRAKKV